MSLNEPHRQGISGELTREDFEFFRRFIHNRTGIALSKDKKYLLEGKLRQHLPRWGFETFGAFRKHIACHPEDQTALVNLGNAVTVNKTDFFRDPGQYRFLNEQVIPEILADGSGRRLSVKLWSAGCATGKEPYSLSMTLEEFTGGDAPLNYSILATDLSTKALEKAELGIYPATRATGIPEQLKKRYLLRGKDPLANRVRIAPALRERVEFRRLNFMEQSYPVARDMDVIFFRNVLIYFDRATRVRVLRRLIGHLRPGGYLFLGSSENLSGLDLPLTQSAPNIYRKKALTRSPAVTSLSLQ